MVLLILYNNYNIIYNYAHAESIDAVPPDEDDVAHVFNHLRQMCQGNNVCNWYPILEKIFITIFSNKYFVMDK